MENSLVIVNVYWKRVNNSINYRLKEKNCLSADGEMGESFFFSVGCCENNRKNDGT